MSLGVALTKWTIWAALLGYALGAAGLMLASREPRWWSRARLAWTLGCVAYLGHVYAAFQFYHGWSHASAFEETARQTQETVGWEVGEGLFVSYFFTVVWLCDVIWWWLAGAPNYCRRPSAITIALHAFFFFIVFNATVVFESGAARWLGLALCLGLTNLWWSASKRKA
ncbi:MAG TPA: hypothetical protein VHP35_07105 [Terriglobia bacterium]|nr:hypothetical protein [Terriglobia bacterium]